MKRGFLGVLLLALGATGAQATEPNETFETATLVTGIFSVADSLGASMPNTMVGNYGFFGIDEYNDDGGPFAFQGGSALYDVSTGAGHVEFAVSGSPDSSFVGAHNESGWYEVFVEAYDVLGDSLGIFSEVAYLEAGEYNDYFLQDEEYIYTYDVWTGPAVGTGETADVDFFTWGGLSSGSTFTVQTVDTGGENIDTLLGWFDSNGDLIDVNDDIDTGSGIYQSLLTGIVPESGQLTFAVTGWGDDFFEGDHEIGGVYSLQLDIETSELDGDFNADGSVDAADYVVWRKGFDTGTYATWVANFGETNGGSGSSSVPEPSAMIVVSFIALVFYLRDRDGMMLACLPPRRRM